jgi:LPS sulfotransferase NodH
VTKAQPIEALFPELVGYSESDFREIGTDRPVLMLAMTARTGSSHLCSGLASVLPIGQPSEIFNARDTLTWEKKRTGANTYGEYLAQYVAASDSIIIFKTNWIDFQYFEDKVGLLFPNLNVIYLNRLDVEAQAVSLFKAIVTGQWHDSPTIRKGEVGPASEIQARFDLLRICRIITDLETEKRNWERYFFEERLLPARIHYEDFQDDLELAVDYILKHMNYGDLRKGAVTSSFKPLSDSVNDEWLMKVRGYRNGDFYRRYSTGKLK